MQITVCNFVHESYSGSKTQLLLTKKSTKVRENFNLYFQSSGKLQLIYTYANECFKTIIRIKRF